MLHRSICGTADGANSIFQNIYSRIYVCQNLLEFCTYFQLSSSSASLTYLLKISMYNLDYWCVAVWCYTLIVIWNIFRWLGRRQMTSITFKWTCTLLISHALFFSNTGSDVRNYNLKNKNVCYKCLFSFLLTLQSNNGVKMTNSFLTNTDYLPEVNQQKT